MGAPQEDNDPRQLLKIVTYIFAGLSMMLNIRLCYSAAPYALLRFKLPENLFSIFVRKMASALELWCLPSMFLGNFIDLLDKYAIDNGHERRQYTEATEYDVDTGTGNPGSRLKLKAEELRDAAEKLHDAANTLKDAGLAGLQVAAGNLKDAASKSDGSGQEGLKEKAEALRDKAAKSQNANSEATAVIDAFEAVRTKYGELTAAATSHKENSVVIAVDTAYKLVEHLFNRILNVKKAKLLKGQAGAIKSQANTLHGNANTLASASGVSNNEDLKKPVEALKTAVGDDSNGLQQTLKELEGAKDTNLNDLITKALPVISAYNDVAEKYKAVKGKDSAYKGALTGGGGNEQTYTQVTQDFTALERAYNLGKCKAITPIYDKPVIRWSSILWNWANFLTFVILFFVFITGGDQGYVTVFYWVIAASGFVFGIYMVFVYAMEWWFLNWYMVGENSFPVVTSFMHYVSILIFGNRRKWNTDYIAVIIDMVISMCIALIAAVLWTYCYKDPPPFDYTPPGSINAAIVSPVIMVLVGMAIVYAIYPAVAPGMIVPFYLIDKIEMVLLIMTCFPPVIVAVVCREKYAYSPKALWTSNSVPWPPPVDNRFWHAFIFIPPLQICLTAIFLYSLHYIDSSIARSIINQPKMSTFLSIIFYMCHEIQLALGFPGMVGNNGGDVVMLPVQFAGALLMVFLAFYSEGYITEYKRYDPSQWPTTGMTKWNAFCYWTKRASKITNHNLRSIFNVHSFCDITDCPTHGYIENIK